MAIQRRLSAWNARQYGRMGIVLVFAAIGAAWLGVASSGLLTWLFTVLSRPSPKPQEILTFRQVVQAPLAVIPLALIGALLGALCGNLFLELIDRLVQKWDRMHRGDKVTMVLAVFLGIIASIIPVLLVQYLNADAVYKLFGTLVVTIGVIVMAVYVMQSIAEYLPWNRGRPTGRRTGIKLLDTNVIIDGRIYDVVRCGFLDGQIYVPGFVLDELQHIADSHDSLRRQRGRRGLDVLRHMQGDFEMEVRIHDKYAPELGDGVDARLVRLAKAMGADIVTNDFNLNRVATLQDVKVLSLNDLALALRSNVMPQEALTLAISREGNQVGQGVGYLEDGTMVVVENGRSHIGETVEVLVTQVIQTERGKMIFAEVDSSEGGHDGNGDSRKPVKPKPKH